MTTRNSHPPMQNSSRRPLDSIDSLHPSSLPPELGSLDMAWDDDPNSVGAIDLLQNSELMDIDVDANERTTAIPEVPMEQLVRATMAEADARESAIPAARVGQTGDSSNEESDASARLDPADGIPQLAPDLAALSPLIQQRVPTFDASLAATRNRLGYGAPLTSTLLRNSRVDANGTPASAPTPERTRTDRDAIAPASKPLELTISEPAPSLESRLTAPPTMRRADLAQMRHQMKDCYATGNFSGALEVSEALLREDPGDLEAQRFVTSCRDVLTQMLLSRIGSTEQYVRVALSPEEMRWLNLDHRAGFFLSLVDGTLTIEELLDVSGMARLESLRILSTLIEQRVLRLEAH